jgi:uncharacterized protein
MEPAEAYFGFIRTSSPQQRQAMHLKKPLLACGILFASSLLSTAGAASFDCTKSDLAADEKAICDNRALNDQDVKMATTFDILTQLMAMGARDTLRDEQSQWLKKRQECAADVACLTGAYEERMKRLGEAFQSINRPL